MRKLFFSFSAIYLLLTFSALLNAQDSKVRLDVLYFHGTIRCQGCLTIEAFTKNSIYSAFADELKDSSIVLTSIDFQQSENEHFQDVYKFESQTLILSKKIDGKEVKWKNLDKIWDLYSNYDKFCDYIVNEIRVFLKESK